MRLLGKTNLKVYEVGLGGIPIQRVNQETVNEIINKMYSLGMNFIDTARAYTNSETLLGNALKGKRSAFILATKSMAKTYEAMKEDINISLKNLQTTYIDIYQIHNPKKGSDLSGPLKALKEAQSEEKIKHIGITNHSKEYLEELITTDDFSTIQFPYNFLEAQGEELFKQAYQKNLGIIIMKPLAGGMIDNGALALKYIMKNPYISVAIPGMGSVDEVISNYSYRKDEFTEEELLYIKNLRDEVKQDFCHRCGYCLPCPQGIDIPLIFTFEAYYRRYGLAKWAQERYDSLVAKASSCLACGACEARCPYQLHIIDKLKKVDTLFKKD